MGGTQSFELGSVLLLWTLLFTVRSSKFFFVLICVSEHRSIILYIFQVARDCFSSPFFFGA